MKFQLSFNSIELETNVEEIVTQDTLEINYKEYAFHDLKSNTFLLV